jgi:hypothetical protein
VDDRPAAPLAASPVPDPATDRFWFEIDYLAACLSGSRLPPLVTASPPGTPRNQAGVIGAPATVVLFGDDKVNDDLRSGVRVRVGGWLDECRTIGFELSARTLDRQSDSFVAGSPNGNQIIARPFVDARTGTGNAELVSFPGVLAGSVAVDAESNKFCAVDALCRKSCCRDCTGYIDVLAGYRYLQFGDRGRVTEQLVPLTLPGTRIDLVDEFDASNRFHGGVVGLAAGYTVGTVSVELQTRVAVGETSRTVSINGATQIVSPGAGSVTGAGGLLAQPTNIGMFRSSEWTVVPDLDLTVGCWLTSHCRFVVGYSVLYWPGVARAGELIDVALNPTQLPPGALVGPARPAFALSSSGLWAQGLSVGIDLRY